MRAVAMVARCEMRRRWRGMVALTLLVGVIGAVVLATVAGARRSDTALGRFQTESRSPSVEFFIGGPVPSAKVFHRLDHVPGVEAVGLLNPFSLVLRRAPSGPTQIAAAFDPTFGRVIDRARLIKGRRANPAAVDEAMIGESLAAQFHVGVGSHLDVLSSTPAQLNRLFTGGDAGPPAGPTVRLHIVGIVRRPLDLSDVGASGGLVVLTPAFNRAYATRIGTYGTLVRIRTRQGAADAGRVLAATRRIFGKLPAYSPQSLAGETEGARSAIDVLTSALWIFAGVAALAGVVAIGIVLTREISLVGFDPATMRALGLTRPQRVAVRAPPAVVIAAGGALLAALGAVAASPLFPLGVARRADPDVGLHADWAVLALGIISIVAIVLSIAFLAALRTAQASSLEVAPRRERRRSAIELTAAAGLPPTVTNGLRMAFRRGRGPTAVPVRSALLGAVFGVLGVTAVLTYSSSLDHLVATPRLYGWTFDFTAKDNTFSTPCKGDDFGLLRQPGVGALAEVCEDFNLVVGQQPVNGYAFASLRGSIGPEVVAGRPPTGPGEIALGSGMLSKLHKGIGDTVQARGTGAPRTYTIVGRVALPNFGQTQALADGAVFSSQGLAPLFDRENFYRFLVGRFAHGSDHAAVERGIAANSRLDNPIEPTVGVEVDRLRQIDWFPATLAALLGSLALLAVSHALITAVRRRRRELALLKTLGFIRRQVRATVAWQATALASVGLVLGIPVGLVIGRLVWQRIAVGLGVSSVASFATLALLLTVPAVLGLINLFAFFPARAAANTRPAVALRSE